jgi:hypothetical protein
MYSKQQKKKRVHIKFNIKKGQVVSEYHSVNNGHNNPKASVNLRKFPKNCSLDDVNSMLKKNNFFDIIQNKKGNFNNVLKPKIINCDKVIISNVTGLMWHQSGSIEPMDWYKGDDWIRELNCNGCAGYSDWRFPTVEEATSLLKEIAKNMNLFTDPSFSNQQTSIWTCDHYGMYYAWNVDFTIGHVYLHTASCDIYFRPVRSC